VAVLFQGRNQVGQDRLEPLATNPVRCLPEEDESLADRFVISAPRSRGGSGRDGAVGREQADSVLAMARGHCDELVEYLGLLRLGSLLVALAERFQKFSSRRRNRSLGSE
jgi:hypothetical protein